jgi:hypothetical protein
MGLFVTLLIIPIVPGVLIAAAVVVINGLRDRRIDASIGGIKATLTEPPFPRQNGWTSAHRMRMAPMEARSRSSGVDSTVRSASASLPNPLM